MKQDIENKIRESFKNMAHPKDKSIEGFTGWEWELKETGGILEPFRIMSNRIEICGLKWGVKECVPESFEEVAANAALISQAPAMYKLIKELVQYLEWREDFTIEDSEEGNKNIYTEAKDILQKANPKL